MHKLLTFHFLLFHNTDLIGEDEIHRYSKISTKKRETTIGPARLWLLHADRQIYVGKLLYEILQYFVGNAAKEWQLQILESIRESVKCDSF
jgi:hypothetical protein